jgi:3'(2'), 5'-bisphosphate nucleotidase
MDFYFELVEKLKEIAVEAGNIILEIYEKIDPNDISYKSDNSPLTLADKRSNDFICKSLSELEPQYPIISEENIELPYNQRSDFEYFWLVDPLDGTKEFINRNGEFTVNIALIHKNSPILGIVYAPCLKELFWASRGNGSYRLKDSEITLLKSNKFRMLDKNIRVVASRSHLDQQTMDLIDNLNEPILMSKGSSLKFLMLASGEADYYPRLAPTMEWDTAAAQIILEEAGGKLLDLNGEKLQYNKENLRNPFFIASADVLDS